MQVIDVRGLSCPQPVIMVKKAIDSNQHALFKVLIDDMAAFENVTAFAKSVNWSVSYEKSAGQIEMTLVK